MQLVEALRLGNTPRLAFVGAGGKSTALFQLARQLLERSPHRCVLVTASTHLAKYQLRLADQHITIHTEEHLTRLDTNLSEGVILVTGPMNEPERTSGLSPAQLDYLHTLADVHQCPLLIEADGSRQRPLKAPAPHEPAIPPWAEQIVVVAGLSGMGKPLSSDWVHRPERYAELTGLNPGERITVEAIMQELSHPSGGLKNIPAQARRMVLLNQADGDEQQAIAQRMSGSLLEAYHSVLVGSLLHSGKTDPAQDQGILAVYEPIAGIVLAAGGASRMGSAKQTLSWGGKALVWYAAQIALSAGLSPVVVVSGYQADNVQSALKDLPVSCVYNPHWEEGQSTSVITGLDTLPEACGGAVFLLADQPRVPASLVRGLVEAHSHSLSHITAPLIDGQRANPVLFDQTVFPDLRRLSGDVGGRGIFARHRVQWLPWHDAGPLFDIDTPEDYQRLLEIKPPVL